MADSSETTAPVASPDLRTPVGGPLLSLGERRDGDGAGHERAADLRRFSELWPEDPATEPDRRDTARRSRSADGWVARCSGTSRSCGSSPASGLLYVVHSCCPATSGPSCSCRATCQASGRWRATTSYSGPSRRRPANTTRCRSRRTPARSSSALLSLLTGLVMYKPVQFSALGLVLWRLSRRAADPFRRDVRPAGVHPGPSGDGGDARVGQLRVDGHRLEASPRLHRAGERPMTKRTWLLSVTVAMVMAGGWMAAARRGPGPPLRSAHSEPATFVPGDPVMVTPSGRTFHRTGCRFIHGPAMRESGEQAVADGYTPCTRCLPQ